MDLLSILVGVLTALCAIYFRESLRLAYKQKIVASQLNSYLLYWQGVVIEKDYFSVYYLGTEWNKKIKECLKNDGKAEDLKKIEEEYKKKCLEVKTAIEEENENFKFDLSSIDEGINHLKDIWPTLFDIFKTERQNLVEGKTFISDEDASSLGHRSAYWVVELKMRLQSAMDRIMSLIFEIKRSDSFVLKDYAKAIHDILWDFIIVSRDIDSLTKKAEEVINQSVFWLAVNNMFNA